MEKDRLVAFSDGVIAVIITIMVLELKAPHDVSLSALRETTPVFLSYVLSFIYVAIYWNNHHHFFHLVRHVGGAMLWANLHLLFWLSLIPFASSWMGEHPFSPVPTAVYGVALLMSAITWYVLQAGGDFERPARCRRIMRSPGEDDGEEHRRNAVIEEALRFDEKPEPAGHSGFAQ